MKTVLGAAVVAIALACSTAASAGVWVLENSQPERHPSFPPGTPTEAGWGNGTGQATDDGGWLISPDRPGATFKPLAWTTLTTTAEETAELTFSWDYLTSDIFGGAFDPAGYVINGVRTQLTAGLFPIYDCSASPCTKTQPSEAGQFTLSVQAGDIFGFYTASDSRDGSARLDFSLVKSTAVPEPATWAMMIVGFGLAGAMVRAARHRNTIYAGGVYTAPV